MNYAEHLSKQSAAEKLVIRKGVFYDVNSGKNYPNLATLKPDKCLWTEEVRSLFVGCIKDNGHTHEDFHVLLFPEDTFEQDGIKFIPAISWKCPCPEKVAIQTCAINLLPGQFKRIKGIAVGKGVILTKLDFMKPHVSIGAMERLEYEDISYPDGVLEN